MAIQTSDMTDVVNSVVSRYEKSFLTDAVTSLRDYVAVRKLWDKKRQVEDSRGGDQYRWPLLYKKDDNTRAVGYFDVDNVDQVDGTVWASVPWRFITTGATYDVKQDAVNSGGEKLFDFIKAKETQMWVDWNDNLEDFFWGGPSSSSDTLTPYGLLKYWLAYSASTGFNGGNHGNFSDGPGGIDCTATDYAKHKHYTAQYTNVSDEDAVALLIKAIKSTRFRGIPSKPQNMMTSEDIDRYDSVAIYTVMDNTLALAALARNKDDSIGSNLGKYDNEVTLLRVPVLECPWLTENRDTSDPFVGIDWDCVKVVHPKGQFFRRTPYHVAPQQHDSRVTHIDASRQIALTNRRRFFLVAKADPTSS